MHTIGCGFKTNLRYNDTKRVRGSVLPKSHFKTFRYSFKARVMCTTSLMLLILCQLPEYGNCFSIYTYFRTLFIMNTECDAKEMRL